MTHHRNPHERPKIVAVERKARDVAGDASRVTLETMMDRRVDPGRVRDYLMKHFDRVEVVEANREGWYMMLCINGDGEDAQLRLRVRFIWSSAGAGGWLYRILPGHRA